MLQLNSNDYGYDGQTLGFPSVMGCQAIVLLTSQGLYGLHDLKAGTAAAAKIKADFWTNWVVTTMGQKGKVQMHKLYGVINNEHQYGATTEGNDDWDKTLRYISEQLGFDGDICKYRITTHIDKGGSLYIRFDDAHDGTCTIQYKRWSKMHSNDADDPVFPKEFGFLKPVRGYNDDKTDVVTTGYIPSLPSNLTNTVNRIGKKGEGTLHMVPSKKIVTL